MLTYKSFFMENTSPKVWISIDMIISKFIPIVWVTLFVIGLWYLIYNSIWVDLPMEAKLGLWFFLSLVMIGGAFSFSDKLRYFADVVMGGGILLLYGTLIYGSRATETGNAAIPEIATLFSAGIFTLVSAYFAKLRHSKVILALGIIGAYLTPFVIGNGGWDNPGISFNAYLIYFAAVNMIVFLMGREIAIHDLIPLNMLGLFFGTSTLYHLSYLDNVGISTGFFSGSIFTSILIVVLLGFCILAISQSASKFDPKDESQLTIGYFFPLAWAILNIERLTWLSPLSTMWAYLAVAVFYFLAWYYVRNLASTRTLHLGTYASGIIALILAVTSYFPEFTVYSSILVAYIALIFLAIYIFDNAKWERLFAAMIFGGFGGFLSLYHIYITSWAGPDYPTIMAIIALIPAILVYPVSHFSSGTKSSFRVLTLPYSLIASILTLVILVGKLLSSFDFMFVIFLIPACIAIVYAYFCDLEAQRKSFILRFGLVWWAFAAILPFLYLISNLAPGVADGETFLKAWGIFANQDFIKAFIYMIMLFLGLGISRYLQKKTWSDRPSFILVIFAYSFLLLIVNFCIITLCNDLGVEFTTWGPRAIGTTIWWIVLALFMLMTGIRYGRIYRSEKLLWLILLALTIGKIGLYDMAAMDTDKKIIVFMVVGWALMMFSYFLQAKWYLRESSEK